MVPESELEPVYSGTVRIVVVAENLIALFDGRNGLDSHSNTESETNIVVNNQNFTSKLVNDQTEVRPNGTAEPFGRTVRLTKPFFGPPSHRTSGSFFQKKLSKIGQYLTFLEVKY